MRNLKSSQDSIDKIAKAIVETEMSFRPTVDRIGEYIFFLIGRFFFKQRISRLTIGKAQMQIIHWENYCKEWHGSTLLRCFFKLEGENFNKDAVKWYIGKFSPEWRSTKEILDAYTGNVNITYYRTFNRFYKEFQ
jgi:hypothetical protein